MEAPPFLTFASTIHDPENRLGYLIEEIGEKLRGSFSSVSVAYTPKTHPKTVSLLEERGYRTLKAEDTVVSCYQTSLSQSLEPITGDIFYCDLDRALHWIRNYPKEFDTLIEPLIHADFTLIGRTNRAFETHPETQTITEGIGNTLASKVLGFQEPRDVLSTTWILTPALAKKVIKLKPMNQFGFYVEWPITLWRSARNPMYLKCEGLEWETPDRYVMEIKALGLRLEAELPNCLRIEKAN
jgi:hypothetical protein